MYIFYSSWKLNYSLTCITRSIGCILEAGVFLRDFSIFALWFVCAVCVSVCPLLVCLCYLSIGLSLLFGYHRFVCTERKWITRMLTQYLCRQIWLHSAESKNKERNHEYRFVYTTSISKVNTFDPSGL